MNVETRSFSFLHLSELKSSLETVYKHQMDYST